MKNRDEGDRFFAVPIKAKFAVFTFKPYWQIEKVLNHFGIPYVMSEDVAPLNSLKKVNSKRTDMYRYSIEADDSKFMFFFTSDVIDKVLKHYKVKYHKGLIRKDYGRDV